MNIAMAVHADPEFSVWQIAYWDGQAADLARPFAAAVERGELPADTDAAALVEMLVGPLLVRTVIMKQELPRGFADRLAAQVVRSARGG